MQPCEFVPTIDEFHYAEKNNASMHNVKASRSSSEMTKQRFPFSRPLWRAGEQEDVDVEAVEIPGDETGGAALEGDGPAVGAEAGIEAAAEEGVDRRQRGDGDRRAGDPVVEIDGTPGVRAGVVEPGPGRRRRPPRW